MGEELHRLRFGAGAVEDHDVAADARHGTEVGDVAGGDAALRPRPVFLAQRDKRAGVAPLAEVGGGFHADAVVRGVEHEVAVVVDEDADVLARLRAAGESPGAQVARPAHADAVLFVEAPPFAGVVLVGHEVGVNHAAHLLHGHVGAFDAEEFRLGPAFEVGAAHEVEPGGGVAVEFAVGLRVGGGAEDPLAAEPHDAAGADEVLPQVARGEFLHRRPMPQVAAGALGKVEIDGVGLALADGEEHVEGAVLPEQEWVAVADFLVAFEEDRGGQGVEQRAVGRMGRDCGEHKQSPEHIGEPLHQNNSLLVASQRRPETPSCWQSRVRSHCASRVARSSTQLQHARCVAVNLQCSDVRPCHLAMNRRPARCAEIPVVRHSDLHS